ncbi:putative plant SNARE 11 [Vitis vinifera]|uniref:Putative plant SNARE 11 n=1 Tax=Vitis vinifera TaxID=29760 RepID=A0A438ITR2_VITVI|nr:putative plant SNARE 11 [Vitis vinifera]
MRNRNQNHSKTVVQDTVNVGTETAAALKSQHKCFNLLYVYVQTEQMSRIVNELDSIHFSIKKASQLVKEIGRQVATDRCIMALLFILVIGVIAVIIVKVGYLFTSTFLFISFLFLPVTSDDFVRVSILFLSFAYPETVGSQALVLLVRTCNEEEGKRKHREKAEGGEGELGFKGGSGG